MTENFKDLQFRGTRWYLAEEVDQKLMELREKAEKYESIKTWIAEIPKPPSLYLETKPYWKKVYEEFVDDYNRAQENIKKLLEAK